MSTDLSININSVVPQPRWRHCAERLGGVAVREEGGRGLLGAGVAGVGVRSRGRQGFTTRQRISARALCVGSVSLHPALLHSLLILPPLLTC